MNFSCITNSLGFCPYSVGLLSGDSRCIMQDGSFYWLRSQLKTWDQANVDNLLSYHFLHQVLKLIDSLTLIWRYYDTDTDTDIKVSWIPFINQYLLPAGQMKEGVKYKLDWTVFQSIMGENNLASSSQYRQSVPDLPRGEREKWSVVISLPSRVSSPLSYIVLS